MRVGDEANLRETGVLKGLLIQSSASRQEQITKQDLFQRRLSYWQIKIGQF
jgi:hypothetical protein